MGKRTGEDRRTETWESSRLERQILEAYRSGDYTRVHDLIDGEIVASWFALSPHRLGPMLFETLTHIGAPSLRVASLAAFLRGEPPRSSLAGGISDTSAAELEWYRVFAALADRIFGKSDSASQALAAVCERHPLNTSLYDTSGGFVPFITLELANSQMLSGAFCDALVSYYRVQNTSVTRFPNILRDARVRLALIHALYGDPGVARGSLDVAASLPRTESWVEPLIDAVAEIAGALLSPADEALRRLERIPTHLIGELWPLHAAALDEVYRRMGRYHEIAMRVAIKAAARDIPFDGNGFGGSITALTMSRLKMSSGDFSTAEQYLSAADHSQLLIRLTHAELDLAAGVTERSLWRAASLHAETAGLRRLDVVRSSVVARALARLGDREAAQKELNRTVVTWGELTDPEFDLFRGAMGSAPAPPSPRRADDATPRPAPIRLLPRLTRREAEILLELATGATRKAIATSLFLSENTVKSHQRSLFKKLRVTNRADAVAAGNQLGLIPNRRAGVARDRVPLEQQRNHR